MTVRIEFDTDNDAFCDFAEETRSILMKVCNRIEDGYTNGKIHDSNGNTVGHWEMD